MDLREEVSKIQQGFVNGSIEDEKAMEKLKEIFEDMFEDYEEEDIKSFIKSMEMEKDFEELAFQALENFEPVLF